MATDDAETLTESDVGKTVVNPVGEEVGIVETYENGTAYVDPSPGLVDEIKVELGWVDPDIDSYPLDPSDVEAVTEEEIRLRQDLPTDQSGDRP